MTLNGESIWGAIKKAWREKVCTPANVEKAGKIAYDAAIRKADDMKHKEMTKDEYKAGLADPVSLAIVAGVCLLFGVVFGHGVTTRSIIVNQTVRVDGNGNVVTVTATTNTVEVSGSGGVSIPVQGAK